MQNILVTGFTPFDGRDINASWVAASSISRDSIDSLEIPVVWGEPLKILLRYCDRQCPQTIISLGEGREGWFDIETLALNCRAERPDNSGQLPDGKPISADGPTSRSTSINADIYQRSLSDKGYPIRISSNAGQFLCEETLYGLEHLRETHHQLKKVLFCHVPPFGTNVHIKGESVKCNKKVLADFANDLLEVVTG